MTELISSADFVEALQECFDRGQSLTFTPGGTSMLPMLDGKQDTVTLSPKPERLKKYDVAMYLSPDTGRLILHRLVGFTDDGGYVFCGDNCAALELGIEDEHILSLLTSFTHRGREHRVTDPSYRLYVHRMMCKKRLRRLAGKVYHAIFDRFIKQP